jgi:hypothetical protein
MARGSCHKVFPVAFHSQTEHHKMFNLVWTLRATSTPPLKAQLPSPMAPDAVEVNVWGQTMQKKHRHLQCLSTSSQNEGCSGTKTTNEQEPWKMTDSRILTSGFVTKIQLIGQMWWFVPIIPATQKDWGSRPAQAKKLERSQDPIYINKLGMVVHTCCPSLLEGHK